MRVSHHAYELYYWHVLRRVQRIPYWIAARMPRWLVYHCTIRCGVHASGHRYPNQSVPELTLMDMLKRWKETNDH